eukprot:COSAG06_NODE_64355_length_259_cov_2.343750_1_plen_35_part_01
MLPRQARDKRGEATQKHWRFLRRTGKSGTKQAGLA